MTEKNLQTIFSAWVRENPPRVTTAWELKLTKGPSIRFDSVATHQAVALTGVRAEGTYHRITDQPWMKDRPHSFTKQKPFDCFFIRDAEAYVVVLFYKPRRKKEVLFISVEDWIRENNVSDRKSLTEERARDISSKVEVL